MLTAWITGALALVSGALTAYWLFGKSKGRQPQLRQLASLLAFIAFLMTAGSAVFSAWAHSKLKPVTFYEKYFVTPYGRIAYTAVKQAEIRPDQQGGLGGDINLLVIEEESGKIHVLSSENYPLERVLEKLKERVE